MTLAADFILAVHAAYVVFVVGGLVATWVGIALRKAWARNPWFRGLHLAAIAFVVSESLLGIDCPLTVWENALREAPSSQGFLARWVHAWLFWNLPPVFFTVAYTAFGLAVAATWWKWPPRSRSQP